MNSSGTPANGSYDLAFTLFATNTTGVAIAGPVTNAAVRVTNGLFTTAVDFGNVFRATPATISPGGSSTLSWCTNASTTYLLFPGPGVVTGTNFVVMPPVTTTYTLVASNATAVISNTTTVVVTSGGCAFAAATNLTGTFTFSYSLTPSSANVIYGIHESANLTVNFTRISATSSLLVFRGVLGGTATVNDSEVPLPNPQDTITVTGSGPPLAGQSANLTIDCASGTYTFDIQPVVDADWAPGGSMSTRVGSVYVNNHALPPAYSALSGSQSLPAHGPLWPGTGDWYFPGGLGYTMFYGTVSESTGGSADVTWQFSPSP